MGATVGPQARRAYLARMRERYEGAKDEAAKSRFYWIGLRSDGLSPQGG